MFQIHLKSSGKSLMCPLPFQLGHCLNVSGILSRPDISCQSLELLGKRTALVKFLVPVLVGCPLHDSVHIRPALLIQGSQLFQLQQIYMSHLMHEGGLISLFKQGHDVLAIGNGSSLSLYVLVILFNDRNGLITEYNIALPAIAVELYTLNTGSIKCQTGRLGVLPESCRKCVIYCIAINASRRFLAVEISKDI